MSELHETLQTLGPIDWSEVPVDNLEPFLQHVFQAGELICNSIPDAPGGTQLAAATPAHSSADSASSSKDITASDARPHPPHADHADLKKMWGKPLKLSAKENQLGMSVYKMAGKDRNGAWFARKSIHEGLSFTKFKRAMQREFAESLAVQGGPGEGNVRGIGGDQRLEKKKVEGVGQLEVYQLSAQFPGPTTPREFITLLSTSESALTDKSVSERDGKTHMPRHYMVVSKPVTHPDAPDRNGYIRGTYESVEMIRELPINPAPHGKDMDSSGDHQLNPVEWIMVTRSDPGGGIPRFMVERGTPSSICADAAKFLDWACGNDEFPHPDADDHLQNAVAAAAPASTSDAQPVTSNGTSSTATTAAPAHPPKTQQAAPQGGIVSHLTNALEAGIETYAPASIAAYTHGYLHSENGPYDSSDDDSSSFESAQEIPSGYATPTSRAATVGPGQGAAASTDTLAVSMASSPGTNSTHDLPSHDKELQKLEQQREKVETKLSKRREAEDDKLKSMQDKDSADSAKAAEKHAREVQRIEERRQKEIAKIEAKRQKELDKAEKKRLKNLDREAMSRLSRERDEFRSQLEAHKRDNGLLRAQVGDLQRENVILVNRLSQIGGTEAVKAIQHDVQSDRKRSNTVNSRK